MRGRRRLVRGLAIVIGIILCLQIGVLFTGKNGLLSKQMDKGHRSDMTYPFKVEGGKLTSAPRSTFTNGILAFSNTPQAHRGVQALENRLLRQEEMLGGHKHYGNRNVPLMYNSDNFIMKSESKSLCLKHREKRGYLTIGIPSIRRPNTDQIYLLETLDYLINQTFTTEQQEVVVVVLLSDFNQTYNAKIAREVTHRYSSLCNSGFIRVIEPVFSMYPNFTLVKKTFKDSKSRVDWRAKQNVDFGFLMLYCQDISEYYIQLEDDVITASNYIQYMKDFFAKQEKRWFLLEFSKLGFIGKMFHSSDLEKVAFYLMSFYDRLPGDLLLGQIRNIMSQTEPIHSEFSLFQHNGKFSSLANKMMPSLDNTFKDAKVVHLSSMDVPRGDNPSAKVVTNLETYGNYSKEKAYDIDSESFFWAVTPYKGGHFSLLFQKPHNFSRIIIMSGEVTNKKDSFHFSEVQVAVTAPDSVPRFQQPSAIEDCGTFMKIGDLVDGDFDTKILGIKVPKDIVCLKIAVRQMMRSWAILRQITLLL